MIRPTKAVCAAAIVLAAAVFQRRAEAAAETGSNGGAFSLLCSIVNMLNAGTKPPETIQAIEQIAAEIGAINLSHAPAHFRDSIKEDKTWQTLEPSEKPSADAEKATWAKYYNFWGASKQQIKKKKEQYEAWGKKNLEAEYLSELRRYAEMAFTAYTSGELRKYAELEKTRKEQADLALYGDSGGGAENKDDAAGTRANTCGQGDDGSSNKAGSTIRRDMACLCSKGPATAVANVCCPDCDYGAEPEWSTAGDAKKKFEHLIKKCPAYAPTLKLTSTNLNGILAKLHASIGGIQGSTAKKQYVLGTLDGNGSGGCAGTSAANSGVCVMYKAAAGGPTKHAEIAWQKPAKLAAAAADDMASNAQTLLEMKTELTLLNVTAGAIRLWGSQHLRVTNTNKVEPTTQCNNHKTNKTCTADSSCKWEGASEADGKCKPKDGEGQTNTAGAQSAETEGKDEKTNTNTTGSNSFAINKAPLLLAVFLF